ncbi:hypothetical protein PtB15_1B232 [Puccinia triticina]|nr:hypothetical protein PtB15_1B232 [Puccinia triticina]
MPVVSPVGVMGCHLQVASHGAIVDVILLSPVLTFMMSSIKGGAFSRDSGLTRADSGACFHDARTPFSPSNSDGAIPELAAEAICNAHSLSLVSGQGGQR